MLKLTTSWKEEGIIEGLRQSTLRILEKRFGSVPEGTVRSILKTLKELVIW